MCIENFNSETVKVLISTMPLFLFVVLIFFVPRGVWKIRKSAIRDPKISQEAEVRRTLELASLESLDGAEALEHRNYLYNKIDKAIDYAIGRHDWYENQRLNILQLSLATSTVIFATCGLAINHFDPAPIEIKSFCILSVVLAIFGVWVALLRYNAELDGDRPYRSVSDIRFWYFRYNIPQHSDASKHSKLLTSARKVLEERKLFIERVADNFNLKESVREDLEQIFILQILQRYKSESLTRMRWTLVYLICAFTAQVLLALILLLWF